MSSTRSVRLPTEPRDSDYEDFVAAYLQSAGNYVEKSIVERSETEVLELDIISTEYEADQSPAERLFEVKSGAWGFPEIFKLSGWGKYLKIDDLSLVVCNSKSSQDFYEKKSLDIGVTLSLLSNDTKQYGDSSLLRGKLADPVDVGYLRYSYLLERTLLKDLNQKKKSNPERESYKALDHYYYTLHSAIFFSRNVLKRAGTLYDLFKENPNITRKVGNEASGNEFSENHDRMPDAIFNSTFYNSQYTDLTYACYVEHRARLAIMKAAVDFCLYDRFGMDDRVNAETKLMGLTFSLKSFLPDNFLSSLDSLREDKYFFRYPVFWQNFLWLFGGFILKDYKHQDYTLLSLKSGIPEDQIDNALSAYEKLFPVQGGWFVPASNQSSITHMKMLSLPFMGIGANYRRTMYTEDNTFDSLELSGRYTLKNLIAWNNLAVEVLSR